jgi:hypothetical protein
LVRSLEAEELARALAVVMRALIGEIGATSADLLARLEGVLAEVAETAHRPRGRQT